MINKPLLYNQNLNVKLEVKNLSVNFSSANKTEVLAVSDVSLQVYEHEFVALIGPSGCGKSTILNSLAGLIKPNTGEILIDHERINGISSKIGYVSQTDTLLPWETVLDNIALGLELKGMKKKERYEKAAYLIDMIGLHGFERSYPHELSGGMKKRVTIARVLAIDPEIFFMDEPFGPLDAFTKEILQNDILDIWEKTNKTVVYVTHDLTEAITLADRVILISNRPGKIKREYNIYLKRPRKVMEIKFNPRFVEIEKVIWKDLREEINKQKE